MIGALLAFLLVQPPPAETPATMHGLGPLRIGMPVSALRGLGAAPDFQPDEPGGCHYWRFPQESQESGLGLMVGVELVRAADRDDIDIRVRALLAELVRSPVS